MLEQPLGYEDIYDHSLLRPQIASPLCLDESITSLDHARRPSPSAPATSSTSSPPASAAGPRRAPSTTWRGQHEMPVWCGGMLETGVGRAAQLALASLPGFTLPGDISATERYYEVDITPPFTLNAADSTIDVPTGPGLGVTIDREQLRRVTLRRESFQEK
jgi:o-succinylbenzoate synthase